MKFLLIICVFYLYRMDQVIANLNYKEHCLVDSATTHTILRNKKFFSNLVMTRTRVNTISGISNLIEGSGRATILLPEGTRLYICDALYSSKSQRNLLSFKDIRQNGFHIETMNKDGIEYLYLTSHKTGQKQVLERMRTYTPGLYGTVISSVETHNITNLKLVDQNTFSLWHDRLGHPGKTMMHRIIENSHGHPLKDLKFLVKGDFICSACSLGKLITKPSMTKVNIESPMFLERIQGDICGPITPSCGPFKYFMVLIDASTRWSHVSLLSTRNVAFARLLAQIIKLRAHFPDYPIKRVRLDNAGEFTSKSFNDFCQSIGITVEHPVAHVHTQNGLAESLIKRLQLIARPLLMRSRLPSSAWGHAILHAAILIRLRPTAYHKFSPLQLVSGREPNISHLKVFGCAVYVPIPPPKRTKMGPQRRLGIYVGFESPSIIKYLEPMTGDQFTARYLDCHFDETMFPALGGEDKEIIKKEIAWNATSMSFMDPRTNESELEVQRIIHLQNIANRLPDALIDTKRVTKSYFPAENVPARLEVPGVTLNQSKACESQLRRKRGRPLGSKDSNPRKRKEPDVPINKDADVSTSNISEDKIPEVVLSKNIEQKEQNLEDNYEMSINYAHSSLGWHRNEVEIDDIFAYSIAVEIMDENENDPQTMEECRHRNDWKSWKEAIQVELDSLNKRGVFGPITPTPTGVKPVGYKWVFVRKRNERNEVVRYKARLVAQGFTQKPGVDYTETYSPVVDATTLRFLISLAVTEQLQMQLMDVVTAYLYGSLDTDIYMRIPEGLKMPETLKSKPRHMYSIKLKRSLYGLKQSGRMWYNRLSEYLIKEGFHNNQISPCLFIKRTKSGYVIIAVYVDDLNIIGSPEEIRQAADYLTREFEMKDLGITKYCLGLQFEHTKDGIFVHQSNYTEKVLKRFHMNNAHPLSTPMVVRSLDVEKDPFRPRADDDEILGPEVPYLSAIGALMYLANNTRPDIAFSVNLLARYSSAPTKRHWNGVKHILRYLRGTSDMGLYFQRHDEKKIANLVGYSDAGYLSDPHKAISQSGYLFLYGGTAISWRSTKQTLVATSSNHAELIALYETGRECVWLRSLIHYVHESCGLESIGKGPTVIYEDNAACIAQIKEGYIKGDRTKHISPKFFSTHELQVEGKVDVKQIQSSQNLADLFTKSLPTKVFKQLVQNIGMRRLKDICLN